MMNKKSSLSREYCVNADTTDRFRYIRVYLVVSGKPNARRKEIYKIDNTYGMENVFGERVTEFEVNFFIKAGVRRGS